MMGKTTGFRGELTHTLCYDAAGKVEVDGTAHDLLARSAQYLFRI